MEPAATCEALASTFRERYGRPPEALARAPGRVNLIGEHTDYNEGWVLPGAIDRDTRVAAAPRSDGRVRVVSRELGPGEFALDGLRRAGDWLDYVRAVCFALAEEGLAPGAPGGCDLAVESDVPVGSGLSSSAALGVGLATALAALAGAPPDPLRSARLAHRGESDFVGVGCGIMDQWASALGRRDHLLRIDCRSRETQPVPFAGAVLLVAHSGVRRELARGGYGDRRAECEAALAAARSAGIAPPGARALRDLAVSDLPALEAALEPRLFRRARHVLTENQRVHATCRALEAADLARVGALLREGMASLRDDFEVSVPELDVLCRVADAHPGVLGSRLTGAGFGGCTLHLVAPGAAADAARAIADGFERELGRRPPVVAVRTGDGAALVSGPAR